MKISLDTKEDSTEDIHKVVRMLQAWLEGHSNAPSDMFSSPSPGQGSQASPSPSNSSEGAFFNMFGDSGSSNAETPSGSVIGIKKDTDNDEIPEIIP
ncbi:MAG: hypothetical protein NT001_02805, partial [Candidatus Woesearchaeota archaeon]|nr:hypothetical protein [Candidatus Woesearchaeota archaeon]